MRRALKQFLALLPAVCAFSLGACGSETPGTGPLVASPPAGAGTEPVTLPPGMREEVAARLKAAIEARKREGGAPRPPVAFAPLKAADVELYLKIAPEMRAIAADIGAVTKLAGEHGLSTTQWFMLQSRLIGTAMGLKHGTVPEAFKADVEVVTPYKDRIIAANQGR